MGSDESLAAAEARRGLESSILAAFSEISRTYLSAMQNKQMTLQFFTSLQTYLDGIVVINGARLTRRGVLLAVHDMKEGMEAPATLRMATKARLMALQMQPLPELKHCSTIATAILRIEAVLRQSVDQAPQAEEPQPLPVLSTINPMVDYIRSVQAALASTASSAMSLRAGLRNFFAAQSLLRTMAASLAAQVRCIALRALAAQHNIGLPSA
jgi:hypothetical protein